jgi:hypothetical protein
MRPTHLFLLALCVALLSSACGSAGAETSSDISVFRRYGTPDSLVQGTLMLSPPQHGQHLIGVTQLATGNCLAEEATIDGNGVLVAGEIWLSGPGVEEATHLVLDPKRGVVELTAASRQISWAVPNDLPWVWQPLISPDGDGALTTPLSAVVAVRAAAGDRPVRSLELDTFHSFTMMADQVVVSEVGSDTVVLGDDAATVTDGLPTRIHHASLGRDLESLERGASPALAALGCELPTNPRAM